MQIDMAWLGVDAAGRVAAFATAGRGPMPTDVLSHGQEEVLQVEEALHELAVIAKGFAHPQEGDASSFVALSERGLFVYDWSDVHRVSGYLHGYELVASPSSALRAEALPQRLRRLAAVLDPSVRLGQWIVHIDGPSWGPG